MTDYSEAWQQGGSFEMCSSSGVELEVFHSESSDCAEANWSHTQTTGWERETTKIVSNTITAGMSHEYTDTFHCAGPTNVKNDETSAVFQSQALCYLWQWVTFVENRDTGNIAILKTYTFNVIEQHGNEPRCVPTECKENTDCQQCWSGPRSPTVSNEVERSIGKQMEIRVGKAPEWRSSLRSNELSVGNTRAAPQQSTQFHWAYAIIPGFVIIGIYLVHVSNKPKGDTVALNAYNEFAEI